MPLVEKREHENYTLVVWDTTEETEFFFQKVALRLSESEVYQKITNDKRRKEWLAVRFIMQEILAIASEITYDQNRKPHIPEVHISISHAGNIVSVIVSKYPCAIDVEEITPRVSKLPIGLFPMRNDNISPTMNN
jgi:phosphopantetheinyl transferase